MPSIRIRYAATAINTPSDKAVICRKPSTVYRELLRPKRTEKRLEFDPNLPKTLTPRGYDFYTAEMATDAKRYQTLVAALKENGELWEDPDFPADDTSIGMPDMVEKVDWMRPKDIDANADIFIENPSRFDIQQGLLSDCCLLAVISNLSVDYELFHQIIPREQSVHSINYVGIFRARFWQFGRWVEVLVDDRIPVQKSTKSPCFMHAKDNEEFWCSLVEKAYAKLLGGYNNLATGHQSEVMEDITGGLSMTYILNKKEIIPEIPAMLLQHTQICCLMGCSTKTFTSGGTELAHGIIGSHAYSITGVTTVNCQDKSQMLIRCRNPWGGKFEWTGAWSDNSEEWHNVSEEEKEKISLKFEKDGEFWMAYEDFIESFYNLSICYLGQESLEARHSINGKRRMEEVVFSGAWERKITAGGCINNRDTFWMNPQFRITLTKPDPNSDESVCTVYVGLMQKDVRRQLGSGYFVIGFMIYLVEKNQETPLSRSQLHYGRPIAKSKFSNSREVVKRFRLPMGCYVIIPSTFDPDVEAQFIVRVLTFMDFDNKELDEKTVHTEIDQHIIKNLNFENETLQEDEEMEERFMQCQNPVHKSITAKDLVKLLNESSLQGRSCPT